MKPIDPEALARFVMADDANLWLAVLAELKEPLRGIVLTHARSIAPQSAASVRLRDGPLISESLEGRIFERFARDEWPSTIAIAEGVALQFVYDTLGMKKKAKGASAQLAKPAPLPSPPPADDPDVIQSQVEFKALTAVERETIKADVIRRRLGGEGRKLIATALGMSVRTVTRITDEARAAGTVFPAVSRASSATVAANRGTTHRVAAKGQKRAPGKGKGSGGLQRHWPTDPVVLDALHKRISKLRHAGFGPHPIAEVVGVEQKAVANWIMRQASVYGVRWDRPVNRKLDTLMVPDVEGVA